VLAPPLADGDARPPSAIWPATSPAFALAFPPLAIRLRRLHPRQMPIARDRAVLIVAPSKSSLRRGAGDRGRGCSRSLLVTLFLINLSNAGEKSLSDHTVTTHGHHRGARDPPAVRIALIWRLVIMAS